jgi:Domain of unknown function (DUF4331)
LKFLAKRLGPGALIFAFLVAAVVGPAPFVAGASSHREAPLISDDPQADNAYVYAFVSPDRQDSVTLIGDWILFEVPYLA